MVLIHRLGLCSSWFKYNSNACCCQQNSCIINGCSTDVQLAPRYSPFQAVGLVVLFPIAMVGRECVLLRRAPAPPVLVRSNLDKSKGLFGTSEFVLACPKSIFRLFCVSSSFRLVLPTGLDCILRPISCPPFSCLGKAGSSFAVRLPQRIDQVCAGQFGIVGELLPLCTTLPSRYRSALESAEQYESA